MDLIALLASSILNFDEKLREIKKGYGLFSHVPTQFIFTDGSCIMKISD